LHHVKQCEYIRQIRRRYVVRLSCSPYNRNVQISKVKGKYYCNGLFVRRP